MTLEQRYIALIDYTVKFPYTKSPRQLAAIFGLTDETVYELGKKLALDIIGRESKNKNVEIESLIKYHPELTVEQISFKTGIKSRVVYEIGKKLNHRFETKYSQRRMSITEIESINQLLM